MKIIFPRNTIRQHVISANYTTHNYNLSKQQHKHSKSKSKSKMHIVTNEEEQAWCAPKKKEKTDGVVCFGNWKTKHMKI